VRARISIVLTLVGLLLAPSFARADDEYYCRENWVGVGRCWRRPHRRPVLTWGFEFGGGHLEEGHPFAFDDGVGSVTSAGPAGGLRIGVDVLSWLGFELRYLGEYNDGKGAVVNGGDVGYVLSAGNVVARLTVPTPFVRPYIFGGVGVYSFHLIGSRTARELSGLNSSTQMGTPIGLGLEVPVTWHISFAVEATYHFMFSESFSKIDSISGGDLSTLTGVMRFRL
jgi:hypothetical protein